MSDMSGTIDELLRDVKHKFPPSLWGELRGVVDAAYKAGYEYRTPLSELRGLPADDERGDHHGGDAA